MRSSLLLFGLVLACGGPTGPNSASGLLPCAQLRQCLCDPDRTIDPVTCNTNLDTLEGLTNGQQICSQTLNFNGCGRPLQVFPLGF